MANNAKYRGTCVGDRDTAVFSTVLKGGVEPPRPFGHTDLNRARLPIPPLERAAYILSAPQVLFKKKRCEPDDLKIALLVDTSLVQCLPDKYLACTFQPILLGSHLQLLTFTLSIP